MNFIFKIFQSTDIAYIHEIFGRDCWSFDSKTSRLFRNKYIEDNIVFGKKGNISYSFKSNIQFSLYFPDWLTRIYFPEFSADFKRTQQQ